LIIAGPTATCGSRGLQVAKITISRRRSDQTERHIQRVDTALFFARQRFQKLDITIRLVG
jgi:hypothetical protein